MLHLFTKKFKTNVKEYNFSTERPFMTVEALWAIQTFNWGWSIKTLYISRINSTFQWKKTKTKQNTQTRCLTWSIENDKALNYTWLDRGLHREYVIREAGVLIKAVLVSYSIFAIYFKVTSGFYVNSLNCVQIYLTVLFTKCM